MFLIETTKKECDSGHCPAFEDTEEEACRVEPLVGGYEAAAERAYTEAEDEEGDPDFGADPFEGDVGGDFDAVFVLISCGNLDLGV